MKFLYQVGNKKFYNKLEAIQKNLQSETPINLVTPYKNNDFTIEPKQSLNVLITNHLKELRDKYKIIKLYYSGGTDSHLLLENIIKNNIKIDEIVCLKSGIPTADYEIENYAQPKLKKFKTLLSHTKITVKKPSLDDYVKYYSKGITAEKIATGAVGVHNYFRLHWPLDFYGEPPRDDVLHIRGMEKPKIIKHGNDYYSYFLDGDLEPHANNYQFFSSDPSIQIKQSHMFLKTFKSFDLENEHDVWKQEKSWNDSIGRNTLTQKFPAKEMYFDFANNHITHKGIKLYYHNKKEQLALKWCLANRPDLLDLWYENLQQLKDITNGKWWNNQHPELGSIGVFSDFYCLTKHQTKTVDELYPNGFKP